MKAILLILSLVILSKGLIAKAQVEGITVDHQCETNWRMLVSVCKGDSIIDCKQASIPQGREAVIETAFGDGQYSVKSTSFDAGKLFVPCYAKKGETVKIESKPGILGISSCVCSVLPKN